MQYPFTKLLQATHRVGASLIASTLLLLSITAHGQFSNVLMSDDEQLQELKRALMDYAVEHRALVSASGWTDSDGALNEDVLVFSELNLESLRPIAVSNRFGVRGTSFAPNSLQAPATERRQNDAQLNTDQKPAESNRLRRLLSQGVEKAIPASLKMGWLRKSQRKPSYVFFPEETQCSESGVTRLQRIRLDVRAAPTSDVAVYNMANISAAAIQQALSMAINQGGLSAVAVLASPPISDNRLSSYQRYLTSGYQVDPDATLRILVSADRDPTILSRMRIAGQARPDLVLRIEAAFATDDAIIFQQVEYVAIPTSAAERRQQMAWLDLPQASKDALKTYIASTEDHLNTAARCLDRSAIPLSSLRQASLTRRGPGGGSSTIAGSSGGELSAGSDIGLYRGQRFAILPNSLRARSRGLEATLDAVGLAEIVSIGPNTAQIEIYAGSSPTDMSNMLAIPLASLTAN